MQRLVWLVMGVWLLSAAVSLAEEVTRPTYEEMERNYQRALHEIERLQSALAQAKQEIARLQQQLAGTGSSPPTAMPTERRSAPDVQTYHEAIATLTTAIDTNPQDAAAHRNRGIAYSNLGDYQHAMQDLNRAMALGVQDAAVYNQRGIVYYHLGQDERALQDFTAAVTRNAQLAEAFNNRAIVHRKRGNYAQAIHDLRTAAEFGLAYATAYLDIVRDEVRQAQAQLRQEGFNPGPADGIPGAQTTAALRQYQQQQGMAATGWLDDATRQALGVQPAVAATSALEARPQFVHQSQPEYPLQARQQGWEGTVTLRIELLANGTVGQVDIASSSGHDILDSAARSAALSWTHKPVLHNSVPITRWATLNINFTLEKGPEETR